MPVSGRLREVGSRLAAGRAFARAVGLLEKHERRRANVLSVLTYHRIAEPGEPAWLDPALVSTTPAEFEEQVAYLASHRPLLSLSQLLEARRGNGDVPPGAVMLTFDDAYRDFAEHAWPVLRRYGVPATLFVATGYPDRPERAFWWDHLHQAVTLTRRRDPVDTRVGRLALATKADRAQALRLLREHLAQLPHDEVLATLDDLSDELDVRPRGSSVLGWSELRDLARDGVTLAAHSRTHPLLDRVPLDRAKEEVVGSLADLEREVGAAPPVFAYPGGAHTAPLVSFLAEAGFAVAFTTHRGSNVLGSVDWLRLRRINVGRRASVPVIRAQLLARSARLDPRARRP